MMAKYMSTEKGAHLHVELNGVHAENDVADVAEHVAGRDDPGECRQLHQLLQLRLPLALVRQVDVSAETQHLGARSAGQAVDVALALDVDARAVLRVAVREIRRRRGMNALALVALLLQALLRGH